MPDYKNGKIYKIECQETNRIYIGSTCQPTVAGRLRGHVQCFQGYKKGKYSYMSSFAILETGNYKCLLVCNYPCDTKDELIAKEAEYIRQYRNDDKYECVNKCMPGRTAKEFNREYRQTEKFKDIRKASHVCGCGGKYKIHYKARHERSGKHMKWEATK